jgi:hypothetical protein
MTPQIYREYSKILEKIAENLDITPTQYEQAKSKYEAVGKWLEDDNSSLKRFRPQISPQGSFRLGTVIKPLLGHEEYDVDLTCKLHILKGSITQQLLKKMVGGRLKENDNYKRMLALEKRRCWRLEYAEDTRFHLDIVPSIPDEQVVIKFLESKNVPFQIAQHALCITDNETWNYDRDFPKSNPEGYAIWFTNRMREELRRKKTLLAEGLRMKVDDIPEYKVKTTLQRVVQLLKRHRDIRYQEDDDKPISIILTTLAAKAYNNETDIYEALRNILSKMDSYIRKSFDGKFQIENPVNPDENFADKWNENKRKADIFFEWLEQARRDFSILNGKNNIEFSELLKPVFGEKVVVKSYIEFAENFRIEREKGNLFMTTGTGILSIGSQPNTTKVPNHTNFGN